MIEMIDINNITVSTTFLIIYDSYAEKGNKGVNGEIIAVTSVERQFREDDFLTYQGRNHRYNFDPYTSGFDITFKYLGSSNGGLDFGRRKDVINYHGFSVYGRGPDSNPEVEVDLSFLQGNGMYPDPLGDARIVQAVRGDTFTEEDEFLWNLHGKNMRI